MCGCEGNWFCDARFAIRWCRRCDITTEFPVRLPKCVTATQLTGELARPGRVVDNGVRIRDGIPKT